MARSFFLAAPPSSPLHSLPAGPWPEQQHPQAGLPVGAVGGCGVQGGFSGSLQQAEGPRQQKKEGESGARGTQKGKGRCGEAKAGSQQRLAW